MTEKKKFEVLHDGHCCDARVTSSKIDDIVCTGCGTVQDGITGASFGTQAVLPKPGSIVICSYCGKANAFDENLNLVVAPKGWDKDLDPREKLLVEQVKQLYKQRSKAERRNRYECN